MTSPIKLDKELNDLDRLVIDFVKILDKSRVSYVLVSGYISILFGRSRSSEDVDLIVEKIPYERFMTVWPEITSSFDCLVPDTPKIAYVNYLAQGTSIRFARKGDFLPNIEFMFPKAEELDNWVLQNAKIVVLNGNPLRISPFELQIPYKLFLGTPKDIEDARHLYKMFKDDLDSGMFTDFLIKLDKQGRFTKYLA